MILVAIVFFLLLSLLVLIHELGHYLVAKKLNIKVEEFGFGLPPRAWGKKIGETIYSINWLPIGGFVKLYGEDEAGAGRVSLKKDESHKVKDDGRAFHARPVWQRASVVVAGVVMNTLLAILIYYLFLGISGFKTELPLFGDHKFFGVNQTNKADVVFTEVVKDSPAEKTGIKPGSKVIAINDTPIRSTEDFLAIVKENRGKEIEIEWKFLETGEVTKTRLTPRENPPKNQGAVGVGVGSVRTAVLSYDTPMQKALSGVTHPLNLMTYNFAVMGELLGISIREKTAEPISDGVSGPVGIFSLVGTILELSDVKERFLQILNLAGILSISLAFFNILPIPALDGGRLFFILIEGIIGRKVSPRIENAAHQIGMMVLIGLILLITFKDIVNLF